MKAAIYMLLIAVLLTACNTTRSVAPDASKDAVAATEESNDTVRIANEELEYEIIIIEPGFESWLASRAKPEGYYSQSYLEGRNRMWVAEWNNRVFQSMRYGPDLYNMTIDYQPHIDYGYEVNYKLYYYLVYFQIRYKQQLTGFIPRI